MEQRRIERDGIRLKNVESFILELVLLAYPLLLVAENILLGPHYLIIALAMIAGIGSNLLFSKVSYSVFWGLIIALLISVPFYFIGMPVIAVVLILVYVFWRMHANFGLERLLRWNFLLINTVAFTVFYFITRSYLLKAQAIEVNETNVLLFVLLTALFIILRYTVVYYLGRRLSNFNLWEASKVFTIIMGAGIATYLLVYFFIESVRTAILAVAGFIFGGIFTTIAAAITPFIDWVVAYLDYLRYKAYQEMEPPELGSVEFQADEVRTIPEGAEASIGIYVTIAVVVLAIITIILILRRRDRGEEATEVVTHKLRSFGRQKKQAVSKPDYDYSMATNVVRSAYQDFEKDAHAAKYPRFAGETVKEWFSRMGWGQRGNLFVTYDKARYGALSITEEESRSFVQELEKIKKEMFKKDV